MKFDNINEKKLEKRKMYKTLVFFELGVVLSYGVEFTNKFQLFSDV